MSEELRPVIWDDERLRLLDQRKLPEREEYIWLDTVEDVVSAIEDMAVRGAPAIGITAAFGIVLATKGFSGSPEQFIMERLPLVFDRLRRTRPTAVNLFWALNRMEKVAFSSIKLPIAAISERLLTEANRILSENIEECKRIGEFGATLLPAEARVITHCNAGALATGGYGTALGIVRAAVEAGKKVKVYADETRPRLQGASLTAWELMRDGIPVNVITDNMSAYLMKKEKIDAVIVGADRIALNGDTANKIGTYNLAIAAKYHNIPFYVAAPVSSIDFSMREGGGIPIEYRHPDEVKLIGGKTICPQEVMVWNPAFDITTNELIAAIITEKGIARQPFIESLKLVKS
ncbi:MAG: S-methyl-5-thioribose-1-phosphate isomerase [Myxococcota bacterium]